MKKFEITVMWEEFPQVYVAKLKHVKDDKDFFLSASHTEEFKAIEKVIHIYRDHLLENQKNVYE